MMTETDRDMVSAFMAGEVTPETMAEFAAAHCYAARRRVAITRLPDHATHAVCRGGGRLLHRRSKDEEGPVAPWIVTLPVEGTAVWELWPVEDATRPFRWPLAAVILLASGLVSGALLYWLGARAGLWGWPW